MSMMAGDGWAVYIPMILEDCTPMNTCSLRRSPSGRRKKYVTKKKTKTDLLRYLLFIPYNTYRILVREPAHCGAGDQCMLGL